MRFPRDRAMVAAGLFCAGVLALFVFATQPAIRKPALYEAASWSILVLISFDGWGAAVNAALFRERRADFGLRAMWGAGGLLVVGGTFAAAGLFSRTAALLLVDVGLVAACAARIVYRHETVRWARFVWRAARINGLVTVIGCAVLLAAALHFVGAVADPLTNPYDDDIAYIPFVRKLLQTGTLIEPFSFRRLSALGGQTFFLSLLAPHTTYRQMNAFDRGVCVLLVVALVLGHRSAQGRRVPVVLTLLFLGFFLSLPNNSINTAAHYSGFAFFLALFRTVSWVREGDRELSKALAIALVAAGACTLRQNYLSVPTVMLAVCYAYRALARGGPLADKPWKERLREPAIVAGASLVLLLPWFVLAYRSNGTFLFPLQPGTYRKALDLSSPTFTFLKDVRFLVSVALEYEPIKAVSIIALAGAVVHDPHPYKPLRALWISSALGLVLLSHAFNLSDAGNIARYLYGIVTALAAAVILTAGTQRLTRRHDVRARTAVYLAVGAMLLQFPSLREKTARGYRTIITNIDQQRRRPPATPDTVSVEQLIQEHVQTFVPEGARVAVMVDYPYHLDFKRNEVLNIDMPGFASLKPDMPYFEGPGPLAQYFLAHDIRYVMYVRPEHSHWLYQREFWFARMFNDEELWRICAPYFVDFIDNLTALRATKHIVHEEAGIVVLDLATGL